MHAFIEKLVNMTTGANPGAHKILIVTDCVHGNINVAEHKSISNISMSLRVSLCAKWWKQSCVMLHVFMILNCTLKLNIM